MSVTTSCCVVWRSPRSNGASSYRGMPTLSIATPRSTTGQPAVSRWYSRDQRRTGQGHLAASIRQHVVADEQPIRGAAKGIAAGTRDVYVPARRGAIRLHSGAISFGAVPAAAQAHRCVVQAQCEQHIVYASTFTAMRHTRRPA